MRYLKVLVLAVFFFLSMLFFFQNQEPLSQQAVLSLNLFFIPPMQSMPLPFYFIVIAAFFLGCVMAVAMLLWDKFSIGAKLMKAKWHVASLEKQVASLQKKVDAAQAASLPPAVAAAPAPTPAPAAKAPAEAQTKPEKK